MPDLSTVPFKELRAELSRRNQFVETSLQQAEAVAKSGRPHTERAVLLAVIAATGEFAVSAEDIDSTKRVQPVALARQVSMYLARQLANAPDADLAPYFKRGVSTLSRTSKKISAQASCDPEFAAMLQRLRTQIAKTLQSSKNSHTSVQTPDSTS